MAVEQTATAPALSVQAKFGGSATVVILVSLAHAMSHAYGALLPLIVPFFQSELQLTYTQIGIMFSVTNLVWGPLQLGFGVLGRYRSRKLLLGFGHICQGLAVMGTGFVHGFTDLLAWRVVSRIADAPQHPIGNALISHSFGPERRGLALAINAAGSNLGTVAVPLLGGLLIATIGWRHTLLLWGLLGVGVGALVVGLLNEQQRTTRDNQGMAKIWGEVWALLRHRDALLLMASHVIGAGGRGLGVATLYVPSVPVPDITFTRRPRAAWAARDHHDGRERYWPFAGRTALRPRRPQASLVGRCGDRLCLLSCLAPGGRPVVGLAGATGRRRSCHILRRGPHANGPGRCCR